MSYLLQIDSSANVSSSTTRQLTAMFAQKWAADAPGRQIRRRDLQAEPLPHLPTNTLHFGVALRPPGDVQPTAEAVRLQNELIDELSNASGVVIGAPMYNSSMPSTLKAWLDYVHVVGATSPPDEGIAPLKGIRVVVVSARATPTGADPESDFVLGPLIGILGTYMSMDVQGIAVHTQPRAVATEFHQPMDVVRGRLSELASAWD